MIKAKLLITSICLLLQVVLFIPIFLVKKREDIDVSFWEQFGQFMVLFPVWVIPIIIFIGE